MGYACGIKLPFDRDTAVERLSAAGMDVAHPQWAVEHAEIVVGIEADSPEGAKLCVSDALGLASPGALHFTWGPA